MPIKYDRLFHLLDEKNVSLNSLRYLKVDPLNPKTIQSIRKGDSVALPTLCRLCDALECDISDIVEYVPDADESGRRGLAFQESDTVITLRLFVNPASAGYGNDVDENDFTLINVKSNPLTNKADYAVRISGYSMYPQFDEGDIVLVKQQPDVNIGEVGIFTVNDNTFIKERGKGELISVNPNFPNIHFTKNDSVVCNGLVLGKVDRIIKLPKTKLVNN